MQERSRVRRTGTWLLVSLASLLLLLLAPQQAQARAAHAQYDHSSPAANARLPSGSVLSLVQVWFTETIDPNFSSLKVYNEQRERVDENNSQRVADDPSQLRISLRPNLPDGAYTVVFENISAEDGHHVEGAFSFVIGGGPLPANSNVFLPTNQSTDDNLNPWSVLLRWDNYLGMAFLQGTLFFLLLVWRPTRSQVRKSVGAQLTQAHRLVEKRVQYLLVGSLGLLFLGWAGMLFYQASVASQSTLWEVLSSQTLARVLFQSRFGVIWLLRALLLLLLLGGWLLLSQSKGFPSPLLLWPLFGLSIAVMLTTSLNAHAAGNALAWLLVPTDLVHLVCTGLWIGGVVALVATLPLALRQLLPGTGDRTRLLAALLPRFSRVALCSVLLLAATGTLMALIQLRSWQALIDSSYGITLLLKLGLFLLLLALGAYSLLRVSPRMRAFASKAGETEGAAGSLAAGVLQRHFRRAIRIECSIALVVFGVVGGLTSLSPPHPGGQATTSAPHWQGKVADLTYQLVISPGIPGPDTFDVLLTTQDGSPLVKADAILVRLEMLDMQMGIQEVALQPVAGQAGHYTAGSSALSMAGLWRITLLIRRAGFDDSQVSFSQRIS